MATSSTSASTSDTLSLHLDGPAGGAENMQRDLELLRSCARGDTAGAIRLYWFSPACLSLGRMQPDADVDAEMCARDGVDVVRRPSGGRAVLHDAEVTYAVICRAADPDLGGGVLDACARIHRAVARGLATLGVQAVPRARSVYARRDALEGARVADCFARPSAHELLDARGLKLAGSAQARLGGALLQHGSVMLEPPRAGRYLRTASSHGARSAGVRRLAGRSVEREELMFALAAGFARTLGLRLTP